MSDFPIGLQHIAMYLRKSRADVEAEAHGDGETLSKHRKALLELANKCRYGIDDVYEEIVSGERIVERPEMQKLLHAVQEQKYTAILCMDIDRLGRGNMIDQGLIQDTFKSSKTLIITPRKVYDLQDELDEEWSEFEAFMARRELKIITRRLQRGRQQSAKEGKMVGRRPPFGYLRSKDLRLYPDPETSHTVQLIFQLSADGMGMTSVANYLTDHGIKTPDGNDRWERTSVFAILKNPVYQGHIIWGRVKSTKSHGTQTGYVRTKEPKENWIIHQNAHEPLVDEETYKRYIHRLNRTPKVSSIHDLSNPLAGLLVCSKCGFMMKRQKSYNKRNNQLLCKTHRCETRGAPFEVVEGQVIQTLREILNEMIIEHRMHPKKSKQPTNHALEITELNLKQINEEITTLEVQRCTLHDLLEQKVYDIDMFVERSRILGERIDTAKTKHVKIQHELDALRKQSENQHDIVPLLMRVMDEYNNAESAQEKNDLLKTVVERITYHREKDWTKRGQFELEIFLCR